MKNLKNLVAIKSDENCDEIIEFLNNELSCRAEQIEIFENENQNGKIMIVGVNTKLKNISPVVLSGHIDTVSANIDLYKTNPFELTKIDDNCYGLGSIDMKSFVAVILDNFEEIKNLDMPIIMALTTDEETTLYSVENMILKFKQLNIKPKFTIVGEPTSSEFSITSNACYDFKVEFFGKACHSSKINEGVNAICAAAKFITFIENQYKKYDLTSNCGTIIGGEVVNKVPDYAGVGFDIRSVKAEDVKSFINDINNYIVRLQNEYMGLKVNFKNLFLMPAFNAQGNQIVETIAKELNIKTNTFSGGCEAGYYTEYSGDAVIFGVGDLALAHKPNEFVNINEYNNYSKKILELLKILKKYYY